MPTRIERLALPLPHHRPHRLHRRLAGIGATLALWRRRARTRRQLLRLDDRLLRDIGLDRHTALREARRRFWAPSRPR